jgi:hypothetical protein
MGNARLRLALAAVALLAVMATVVVYVVTRDNSPSGPSIPRPHGAGGLAKRFQPVLRVSRKDGFWPVSVLTMPKLIFRGRRACIHEMSGCRDFERITDLSWLGERTDWIEYPARLDRPKDQRRSLLDALGDNNPFDSSQEYFVKTGGGASDAISLQYWFYYTDDYQPIRYLGRLLGVKAGFHEGDFESAGVLLSRDTHRPAYVWTARHEAEGERFAWNEPALTISNTHPVLWAARGSHATYESCGSKRRPQGAGFIDDLVDCGRPLTLNPDDTPLVDLARSSWTCWRGYFGHAFLEPLDKQTRRLKKAHVLADAPLAPLWQQRFDDAHSQPCAAVPPPAAGEGESEEVVPEATANALRQQAGRYDELFRTCPEWRQRPTAGGYLVACDQRELTRFFKSGLENPGSSGLRIEGPQRARGPTVPAVYRSPDTHDIERATITADRAVRPTVYASAYRAHKALAARFPPIELRPGGRVRLKLGGAEWRLVDEDGNEVTAPVRPRPIGKLGRPPAPKNVAATRSGRAGVTVTFTGSSDPDVTFLVYVAPSAVALSQAATFATAVDAEDDGTYRVVLASPGANFVRVVAMRFGRPNVAAAVKVSAGH